MNGNIIVCFDIYGRTFTGKIGKCLEGDIGKFIFECPGNAVCKFDPVAANTFSVFQFCCFAVFACTVTFRKVTFFNTAISDIGICLQIFSGFTDYNFCKFGIGETVACSNTCGITVSAFTALQSIDIRVFFEKFHRGDQCKQIVRKSTRTEKFLESILFRVL